MKREGIAYGPVIGYTALLIAASGALGWVVTGSWYPLAILLVPVIGIAAYRLIGLYSDSIRRVTFMFNAIDNDDFTFRFHEDPSKVDNGMLNAALNRIKEILVRANTAQTKLRSIVSLVQTADSLKSEGQSHMEDLANKIVPWNFLLAGLVALTTRSLIKTSAALMVDYSCALKLTGSVAVMTAMSDAAKMGVMVKGAKYFESFAKADTIVFDKTGTLTEAQPRLACVLTTDGWSDDEVLRLSACLEEHFPHPVARAVVNAARERGLEHRERHAAVEYIVAHGIASSIEGRRAIIGSAHFVFEDEGAQLESDIKEQIELQMQIQHARRFQEGFRALN